MWTMLSKVKKWFLAHSFKLIFLLLIPVLIFSKNILSYVNTHLKRMKSKNTSLKIVVFDLDETLGYFTEISIFWDALEHFYGHNLFNDKFYEVLDVFPEVFRPNIINILDVLTKKKLKKSCHKIFIYTNNQGPKSWVNMISEYINTKVGHVVFDYNIGAYKVKGKQIEPKRTSHEKSVTDLISCTNIPANTEICFIDDLYHHLMDKENVLYIQIKPYKFSMPFKDMATRYYKMVLNKYNQATTSESDFTDSIVSHMKQYNYNVTKKNELEEKTDIVVSKQLLSHLDEFLKRDRLAATRKKRNRKIKTMRRVYKY